MGEVHTFLMIGCNDNGVHTEAVTFATNIGDAYIAFAKHDVGPIKFIEVAQELREAEEINEGDLTVLEVAKETCKVDIGEIDRYRELVSKVNYRVVDIASKLFNSGQFATGDEYDGREHNNYVDGDSVSQWKIYKIKSLAGQTYVVEIYPKRANKLIVIREEVKGNG